MAFTTWSALRTAIKDAIADYVAGSPITGSYTINGRTMTYRSIDDLKNLLDLCDIMESRDNAGTPSSMVSYGRHRRFR